MDRKTFTNEVRKFYHDLYHNDLKLYAVIDVLEPDDFITKKALENINKGDFFVSYNFEHIVKLTYVGNDIHKIVPVMVIISEYLDDTDTFNNSRLLPNGEYGIFLKVYDKPINFYDELNLNMMLGMF